MSRGKQVAIFVVIAALLVGGIYLWGGKEGLESGKGTIKIGHNNYVENIAVSHLWKQILEEKGYRVELTQTEKAPLWTGVAGGNMDMAVEVWLPHTDAPYYDQYKDRVELHEPWYKGTALGLVVPEYMKDVETISDLNRYKDQFKRGGKPSIVGIDPGASLMGLTEKAIQSYDLDYKLIESSEPAMLSELDSAYKKKEPVVVTLWNPHWVFNKYGLKYLKDTKKVYGEPDTIYYVTRKGFKKDQPEVVQWMDNWHMDDETLGALLKNMEDADNPEQAVKQWMDDHRELIEEWTKK
ncbi:proline/glycine betaine ABC superfamily ATP binding cassette transporter, membrane protein [Desmospora sp. 8437]|nr:proline/glycine betaine ABC superfamily ATP binding cassette transporter, membrane protein [Desmospora sp. 8437]